MSLSARILILPALASLFLLACGGNIERVPDATSNGVSPGGGGAGGSGGSGGGGTCTMAPACNRGDTSFTSQAKACIEIAGMSCYERSACGSTIWCQHFEDAQCDGYPECNPGEHQVKACVPDSECKTYSSCGVTIICEKDPQLCEGPQPICDLGDTQVWSQQECPQDAKCYSRSNRCGFTIWCTGPA